MLRKYISNPDPVHVHGRKSNTVRYPSVVVGESKNKLKKQFIQLDEMCGTGTKLLVLRGVPSGASTKNLK